MNDSELLQKAAMIAGPEVFGEPGCWFRRIAQNHSMVTGWNPLTDDGDALRLAVKLGLQVLPYPIFEEPKHSVIVQKRYWDSDAERAREHAATLELYDGDPCAATRRAIVRAAAELSIPSQGTEP